MKTMSKPTYFVRSFLIWLALNRFFQGNLRCFFCSPPLDLKLFRSIKEIFSTIIFFKKIHLTMKCENVSVAYLRHCCYHDLLLKSRFLWKQHLNVVCLLSHLLHFHHLPPINCDRPVSLNILVEISCLEQINDSLAEFVPSVAATTISIGNEHLIEIQYVFQ